MSISALGSGLAGMQAYQSMANGSAGKVASSSTTGDTDAMASGLIGGVEAKDGFAAAAKVVKSANEMIGTLINTTA
ncbi:hypothetical protein JCM19000A_08090 [Silvimonas sp. JCM 19000]